MRGFRRPKQELPAELHTLFNDYGADLYTYKDALFARTGDHKNKSYQIEIDGHVVKTDLRDLLTCVYWYDKYMPISH